MTFPKLRSALALSAAFALHAQAGTLFYVPIPPAGSDAQSGLDSAKTYTSAIAAGTAKPDGRSVNGLSLTALSGAGNAASAGGVTVSAATGTLTNGGGKSESIQADGATVGLLSSMIFNDGAADNSEQYVVLDPATLTAGKAYDLRVYLCNASGENRQVNLSFAGDGRAAVNTDFFNEDDATTSAGGFAEPNQVYYINYRFTWDGVSTPGFTATQKFGAAPFCLFALTNQEVGGTEDARPAGAVVALPPEAIAEPPRRSTTSVVETEDIGVVSDVFYNASSLRNHGRWVTVGTYGRCWQPTDVDEDWQPYTRGHWVNSADGWVWVSDEEFGWATYHYGRWFREEDSGWYWVPGKVWAPSWVSWRHGNSYVGWAALPPAAVALAGVGISSWADHRWGIGPRAYNFVNVRDFAAPSMARVLIPRQQNPQVMARTNNVTNIVNTRRGIYSGGPNILALNNALGRSGNALIPTVQINRNQAARPLTPDGKFSRLTDGILSFAAPMVTRTKKPVAPPPVAATIAAPKFDKGWSGLPDAKNAAALQAKIANETPGTSAKNAPANLPGMPSTAADATTPSSPLKPFRPGNPNASTSPKSGQTTPTAGTTMVKPGQPISPPSAPVSKPGQPVPTSGSPLTKPGQPAPTANTTPVKPGQPAQPKTGATSTKPGSPADGVATPPAQPTQPSAATQGGKKRSKTTTPTAPTVPVSPPNQPGASLTENPQRPGQPVKPGRPTETTVPTPAQTEVPPPDRMKKRGKLPKNANIPTPQPTTPAVPTAPAPSPTLKPSHTPAPIAKPTAPPISSPETNRPKRRTPENTMPPTTTPPRNAPAPDAPKPAAVARSTPRPAPPVAAPQKPVPAPRPAPPVSAPVKPAAPVAAPVKPVPSAPPSPRPAPPVPQPAKPAPTAPGGKPTPTPVPGTKG